MKDDVDESRVLRGECDREESPKCQLELGIRNSAFKFKFKFLDRLLPGSLVAFNSET